MGEFMISPVFEACAISLKGICKFLIRTMRRVPYLLKRQAELSLTPAEQRLTLGSAAHLERIMASSLQERTSTARSSKQSDWLRKRKRRKRLLARFRAVMTLVLVVI